MSGLIRSEEVRDIVQLSPHGLSMQCFDLFEQTNGVLSQEHCFNFCGFRFDHRHLEVDDSNYCLYIGVHSYGIWAAYVTSHGILTESYLGIVYDNLVIFANDGDHDFLETSGDALIAFALPCQPIEKLAWLAGARFAERSAGLPSSVCRQIANDPVVRDMFL